jgi:hypothetical protein
MGPKETQITADDEIYAKISFPPPPPPRKNWDEVTYTQILVYRTNYKSKQKGQSVCKFLCKKNKRKNGTKYHVQVLTCTQWRASSTSDARGATAGSNHYIQHHDLLDRCYDPQHGNVKPLPLSPTPDSSPSQQLNTSCMPSATQSSAHVDTIY